MDTRRPDADIALSYIVPAHNSARTIRDTLSELGDRLADLPAEIVVVENGSSDDTLAIAHRIQAQWPDNGIPLRISRSDRGLGNALRTGIAHSQGDVVFLGADDLPFGFGDLDAALRIGLDTHPVIIGSKAHADSVVDRTWARDTMSFGFRLARRAVLGMRTGDPQGTFILDGDWARAVAPLLAEPGFLFTTELCYLAERAGIRPVEVAVVLRESHAGHGSRIRFSDVWRMFVGLFVIRRRHQGPTAVAAPEHAAYRPSGSNVSSPPR